MADYSPHLRLIVQFFLGLVVLFLFSAAMEWDRFWRPVVFSMALVLMAALILARFGGDLGRTL